MAPGSAQRKSSRKRVNTSRSTTVANVAPAASSDSPSRSSKRRKTTAQTARPRRQAEPEIELQEEDSSEEEEEETNTLAEPADRVTPVLAEASYQVLISSIHPNREQDESIAAYAKIAGRGWTYYVREAAINIGRSADQRIPGDSQTQAQPSGTAEEEVTHIDLGPHKLVSRLHAKIFFNAGDERWHLRVIGRNGVRVNDDLYKREQEKQLQSGDVLEIAGTEMIFVSPDVQAVVHPKYLARLNPQDRSDNLEDLAPLPHGHPNLQHQVHQALTHISPYAQHGSSDQPAAESSDQASTVPQSTPVKNLLNAPYLSQNTVPLAQSLTPRQGHPPSVMESHEEKINYSLDAFKHLKPPMSYATLIGQAILSEPSHKLSLNGIYKWIKTHFSYYRHIEQGWQNSIRHNLSLNHSFIRIDRDANAPGKGGLWYIAPDKKEEHIRGGLKHTSRGGARQSSNPSSPAPKRQSPKKNRTPPKMTEPGEPVSLSQNTSSFEVGQPEAQTPSRAPRGSALTYVETQPLPQLSDDASPLPTRAPYLSQNSTGGRSPPTLSSSAYFGDDSNTFLTPAPRRHDPQMAAPSTQKLPSKYLPASSPAPFWKQVDVNAPALPGLDTSPIKGGPSKPLQSSSPPPLANCSPTRRRATPESRVNVFQNAPVMRKEASPEAEDEEDEEDEEAIDLMGQFPKIGEQNMVSSSAH